MKKSLIIIFVMVLISVSFVFATDYYATPNDSLSNKISQLTPGDTLILRDGTYYQTLNVNVSGNNTHPITIKAENEGKANIDGQFIRKPCIIDGPDNAPRYHDLIIEGLICRNSSGAIVIVHDAENIIIKKVTAYNPKNRDYHGFSIWKSDNVLLEDIFSTSENLTMDTCINVLSSNNSIIRRGGCYHTGGGPSGNNQPKILQVYNSDNSLIENVIARFAPRVRYPVGYYLWANSYLGGKKNVANNNIFKGNVIYSTDGLNFMPFSSNSDFEMISGNIWDNNVAINTNSSGFVHRAGNVVVTHHTSAETKHGIIIEEYYEPDFGWNKSDSFEVSGSFYNNIAIASVIGLNSGIGFKHTSTPNQEINNHFYNLFYNYSNPFGGRASMGIGENISLQPSYNISAYGYGAYLISPYNLKTSGCKVEVYPCPSGQEDYMGAEVLYQYEDGILNDKPLWPWPMEDRIQDETYQFFGQCYSVTYESIPKHDNSVINCTGGLWKTLEGVYDNNIINSSDINTDGFTDIKDIRICMNNILIPDNYFTNCSKLSLPDTTTDLNDVKEIVNNI